MKIIAGNITNLTDARYFSAIGVEALIFSDQLKVSEIKEIAGWVSGPELWIDISDRCSNYLINSEIGVAAFVTNLPISQADNKRIFTKLSKMPIIVNDYSIINFEINKDLNLNSLNHIYLSIHHTPIEALSALHSRNSDIGFYVEGSLEDEVGLKSFEKLDNIIDTLF